MVDVVVLLARPTYDKIEHSCYIDVVTTMFISYDSLMEFVHVIRVILETIPIFTYDYYYASYQTTLNYVYRR